LHPNQPASTTNDDGLFDCIFGFRRPVLMLESAGSIVPSTYFLSVSAQRSVNNLEFETEFVGGGQINPE
jgi:hypothetical protein